MRLQENPFLPAELGQLVRQLTTLYREYGGQINQLSEGQIQAVTNAATAAPTGTAQAYQQGDFVRNLTPAELGAPGAKYVIFGWVNTVAGSPGTFVECRFLTGA